MNCREVQEKIMPFIHEELSDDQLESFMEHVDSCKECREELEISYSIFWGLRMLQGDMSDSFDIQQAIEELMERNRRKIAKRDRRKKFFFGLFVGFLFVVIVFFAIQIIRMVRPQWIAFLL